MDTAPEVYARLMSLRGKGLPLWEPEPPATGPVRIGDVGYVRNGRFYRLFNSVLPAEDPVNARFGVPDGHEALLLPEHLLETLPNAVGPGPLCSRHVAVLNLEASL